MQSQQQPVVQYHGQQPARWQSPVSAGSRYEERQPRHDRVGTVAAHRHQHQHEHEYGDHAEQSQRDEHCHEFDCEQFTGTVGLQQSKHVADTNNCFHVRYQPQRQDDRQRPRSWHDQRRKSDFVCIRRRHSQCCHRVVDAASTAATVRVAASRFQYASVDANAVGTHSSAGVVKYKLPRSVTARDESDEFRADKQLFSFSRQPVQQHESHQLHRQQLQLQLHLQR
mmetsp:Transcript_33908/g.54313  ORF Transcript_33908/g.54313 Transcript_33908/m.54313 type:complete len:225 (+) Transcript_33908:252-926(+)